MLLAVERLRRSGDESSFENLQAEIIQQKKRKTRLEELVALKQSEVSF